MLDLVNYLKSEIRLKDLIIDDLKSQTGTSIPDISALQLKQLNSDKRKQNVLNEIQQMMLNGKSFVKNGYARRLKEMDFNKRDDDLGSLIKFDNEHFICEIDHKNHIQVMNIKTMLPVPNSEMDIKSFRIRIGFVIDGFIIVCNESKDVLVFDPQQGYQLVSKTKTTLWANHAWITSDKHVIVGFRENGNADVFRFEGNEMVHKIKKGKMYPENIYSFCEISKNKFFIGGKDHGAHGYYIRLNSKSYSHGKLF